MYFTGQRGIQIRHGQAEGVFHLQLINLVRLQYHRYNTNNAELGAMLQKFFHDFCFESRTS